MKKALGRRVAQWYIKSKRYAKGPSQSQKRNYNCFGAKQQIAGKLVCIETTWVYEEDSLRIGRGRELDMRDESSIIFRVLHEDLMRRRCLALLEQDCRRRLCRMGRLS